MTAFRRLEIRDRMHGAVASSFMKERVRGKVARAVLLARGLEDVSAEVEAERLSRLERPET